MVDVESKIKALKAAWVSRISDSSNSRMSAIFRIYLREIGINLQQVLLMNFQHEKEFTEIKSIPTFYRECLLSYNQIKTIPVISNTTSSVFMIQIIWGNRLFTENVKAYISKVGLILISYMSKIYLMKVEYLLKDRLINLFHFRFVAEKTYSVENLRNNIHYLLVASSSLMEIFSLSIVDHYYII